LPYALIIVEYLKHGYGGGYDRRLLLKLTELYSQKSALQQLKLHYARKLTLMLGGLLAASVAAAVTRPDISFIIFCLALEGMIFYFTDNEINEKVKKRRLQIKIDFPEFINRLTLVINAGMNIPRALEKIVRDSDSDSPLYRELSAALTDMASGKPEAKALEDFSRKCRTPEIMKFVSVILQNMRKGSSEMVPILRLLSVECWEIRKNTARKMGDEASTKLLFPMMIMFIAILFIVVTPAILALQGI
jgi:tight adherence protein C